MTTKRARKKTALKRKNFYGVEEFEKDMEKEHGPITFGRLLESHRKCEEWTQEEVGQMLGISRASVCDLEKGRKVPSPSRAFSIASIFGVWEPLWVQYALQDQLRIHGLDFKVSITS